MQSKASEVAHPRPSRVRRMRFFAVSFLFVAGIVNYLDRTSFSIANTSIRADLGLSGTRIGALLSAFSLAYGIAQLPIGLMLDRLGSRVILAAGMFVWSLAQMATGLVSSFGGFMATRISLGAGEAPMMPCGVKVMNDWFGVRDRGLPTGLLTASNTLGVTLAPPVLTVIMLAFGWRAMFVSVGLFSLLLSLAWYPLYRDRERVRLDSCRGRVSGPGTGAAADRNVAARLETAISLAHHLGHDAGFRRGQLHHLALPVVAARLSAGGTAPDDRQDRLGGDHSLPVRHPGLDGQWRSVEPVDPPRHRSHCCEQDSYCGRNVLLSAEHARGGLCGHCHRRGDLRQHAQFSSSTLAATRDGGWRRPCPLRTWSPRSARSKTSAALSAPRWRRSLPDGCSTTPIPSILR